MEKIKYEDLETVINKYKTAESKISIEVKDFNENIIIEYNSNLKVNSASCIKVAIMMAVLKKIKIGELELDKVIEFKNLKLDDEDGIYKSIFRDEILTEELGYIAKNILHRQRIKNASQRYIYEDIEVYHKTGGLENLNLRNDCGYFVLDDKAYYF